jgi:hypothetical protein
MSKSEQAKQREHRLAAKLRENLKRRKGQSRQRTADSVEGPERVSAPPGEVDMRAPGDKA